MCGINGFTFHDESLIKRMNQCTSHRGPDETQVWLGDSISFGHNRLAIIDLSERGRQPMWDSKKEVVIIFNGEIYNFKDLRAELQKTYTFHSDSDTEVILYAYKQWGVDCFQRLNGVFALAIFDTRTNELIVARDRIGVNPLYYFDDGKRFIFSSEIKALLVHDIPRAVDQKALALYLELLYTPEPYTMFEGIKKLPPATYLRVKNGQSSMHAYWRVEDFTDMPSRTDAAGQIRSLFDDAVTRQLVSDRPVGVFLSGGIDSTAVLGSAARSQQGKIQTFSVGFNNSIEPEKFNADFFLARQTARVYDTDHHELMISSQDVLDALPSIAWHMDEPNSNPTAAAMYLLARMAKKDVAVVLGGDGGDELFGGYPRYYYSGLISRFQRVTPSFIRTGVFATLRLLNKDAVADKLSLPPTEERMTAFLSQKASLLKQITTIPGIGTHGGKYLKDHYSDRPSDTDFEKWFMHVDRQSWLVDESLLRTNKMCMASGLEPRVPLLDYRLVEIGSRIPTKWKVPILGGGRNKFQGKTIWRDAIADYLPDHVAHQQKRGWFTPMAKWLREETMSSVVSDILHELPAEFFDIKQIETVWNMHREHKAYNMNIIWALVMWQLWYKTFIVDKK